MTCKPREIRRFKPKPKKSRTLWRSGRVIKKGHDMKALREQAWQRSEGYCENKDHHPDCPQRIFWNTFELHHLRHRGLGGSDVIENVLALSQPCHRMEHGEKSA